VMVLPLGLAAFFDLLLQMIDSGVLRARDRFGLVNAPQFGRLLFLAGACGVMGLSLLMTRSRSGLAAFAIGAMITGGLLLRRQAARRARIAVAASVLVLLAGTTSWAGYDTILSKFTEAQGSKSFVSRVGAWTDTIHIAGRFPVTGSGLDTYGTAMHLYQSTMRQSHFQEAHNDFLQLSAEGGLLVGVPIVITVCIFIRDVRRRFRQGPHVGGTYCLRVGAVAGLISIALQSLFEFSLQMPGNAALFAVLASIAVHERRRTGGFAVPPDKSMKA